MKIISKMLSILFILLTADTLAQNIIDIQETSVKISAMSEEKYLCGLAEGDELIFNFEEEKGKELKEVEILEYEGSSKYMEYKCNKIKDKKIQINHTGIFVFRFYNSSITGRICKFKIQRIPVSDETKNFNTSVYYKSINDTTYKILDEDYLIKSDTSFVELVDQVAKVHSVSNLNGSTNEIKTLSL